MNKKSMEGVNSLLTYFLPRLRSRFPSLQVGLSSVEEEEGKGEGRKGGGVGCGCRSLLVRCVGNKKYVLILDVRWMYQDEDIADLFRDVIVGMSLDIKRFI